MRCTGKMCRDMCGIGYDFAAFRRRGGKKKDRRKKDNRETHRVEGLGGKEIYRDLKSRKYSGGLE